MKKNTSGQHLSVTMIDVNTGNALIGATLAVRRTLDGINAPATGIITEPNSDGEYLFSLSQADTNGDNCAYHFTTAGAIPITINVHTESAVPFPAGAIEFTYTFYDSVSGLPIEGADVFVSTDNPVGGNPANIVWRGTTDIFGVARDVLSHKPHLDPGTYYFWVEKAGKSTDSWPDTEIVS